MSSLANCPYHRGAAVASAIRFANHDHFCYLCQTGIAGNKPTYLAFVRAGSALEQARALHEQRGTTSTEEALQEASRRYEDAESAWQAKLDAARHHEG